MTEEQVKGLVEAMTGALPAGERLYVINTVPRVGFGDTEARQVTAFVLAEEPEDFERFRQIIARGEAEYAEELGMSAAVFRQIDMRQAWPSAPTIGGPISDWANKAKRRE
ncbi:hypothetical protein PQR33_36145 [Paraburkholderia sediminicola]|uniref:hypothetical protein n=1 Tax=Paraburkholderia sediminicola TaxID=458836 RepID=UPI0038BDB010